MENILSSIPNVTSLDLRFMKELKMEWIWIKKIPTIVICYVSFALGHSIPSFQNIESIFLYEVNIQILPFPSYDIGELIIEKCGYLTEINDCYDVGTLTIQSCPRLEKIGNFRNIRKVELNECPQLDSWIRFENIRTLSIKSVPRIESVLQDYIRSKILPVEFQGIRTIDFLK
jgi:hypothetical protein